MTDFQLPQLSCARRCPTAAVQCSTSVIEKLSQLNQQAIQIQKGTFRHIAQRAVERKRRDKRIEFLTAKVSQTSKPDKVSQQDTAKKKTARRSERN